MLEASHRNSLALQDVSGNLLVGFTGVVDNSLRVLAKKE